MLHKNICFTHICMQYMFIHLLSHVNYDLPIIHYNTIKPTVSYLIHISKTSKL